MAAVTHASPESLPPIGELIAGEPAWMYPIGMAAEGIAHLARGSLQVPGDPEQ